MVAAAVGGSAIAGLAGDAMSSHASKSSANQISQADSQAEADTQKNLGTVQGLIQPYMSAGTQGLNDLSSRLDSLTTPFSMTEAQLEQTPGYQFNLKQGEQGVTNAAAARGLGVSGAALKGAANYATGLADSTYQNQFNDYQTQQQNNYNRLTGVAGLGANAAVTYANAATGATTQENNLLTNSAQAQAAGTVGSANAWEGGLNDVGSSGESLLAYNKLFGNSTGSNGGSVWDSNTEDSGAGA